jgi:predicted RNase H-like nuclease (RuvC/YqgF family)
MNKFYVIFPTVLLIAFGLYYTQIAKPEMAEQERIAADKVAQQAAVDEARRQAIEAKAGADAQVQQQAREQRDREKQEKALREREEQDRQVAAETAKFESEAASLTRQIADMDRQVTDLRAKKENLTKEVFDAAARVELAKIDRRNAELEVQRMYGVVAQKVGESFLTKLPPPPKAN